MLSFMYSIKQKFHHREFPGSPVFMTPAFTAKGQTSISDQGTKIPQAAGPKKKKERNTISSHKELYPRVLTHLSLHFKCQSGSYLQDSPFPASLSSCATMMDFRVFQDVVALCLVNIQAHSFYQGSQPVLGAWARELFQVWVKHFREFPVSEISSLLSFVLLSVLILTHLPWNRMDGASNPKSVILSVVSIPKYHRAIFIYVRFS